MEAALAHGTRRVVAQSVAFLYAPEGGPLKDEQARPWTDAPAPFDGAVAALLELERTVTGHAGIEGLILRYGALYGPGTWYARDGDIAEQVRRRRFPLIGDGGGLISWLHVEDAAATTVRAVPVRRLGRLQRGRRRAGRLSGVAARLRAAPRRPAAPAGAGLAGAAGGRPSGRVGHDRAAGCVQPQGDPGARLAAALSGLATGVCRVAGRDPAITRSSATKPDGRHAVRPYW
jgi:nucleoside-diphosphate-sugar epimerase